MPPWLSLHNARVRELYADLAAVVADMDCAACLALCEALDIPATRIYALDELREHPQLVSVGLFETHEHPTEGPTVQVRPPVRFGATPARIARLAPALGEHSAEVLREAGLSDEEIEVLAATGAVKQAA